MLSPGDVSAVHAAGGATTRRGLSGGGLLAVWSRVRPADEDELNRWYTAEHLPERLAVPGFLGARRYLSPDGQTYLALYELADPAVLDGPDYQAQFTQPTAWTRRVLASFEWSRRRRYRLVATRGAGIGGCAGALFLPGGDDAGPSGTWPSGGELSGAVPTGAELCGAALSDAASPHAGPFGTSLSSAVPSDAALLDEALSGATGPDPGLVTAHLLASADDRLLLIEGTPDAVRARCAALAPRLGLVPGQDVYVGDLLVCV